jgi:hypothetical protein
MTKTNEISRKETRKQVELNLEMTLAPLVPVVGNKDFKHRLKRAGKAFTKGLKNRKGQMALERLRKLNGIEEDTATRKKDRLILER